MKETVMEPETVQEPVVKDVDVVIRDKDTKQMWTTYGSWTDANADRTSWEKRYPNAEAVEVART